MFLKIMSIRVILFDITEFECEYWYIIPMWVVSLTFVFVREQPGFGFETAMEKFIFTMTTE